jgi:hypothetical protein
VRARAKKRRIHRGFVVFSKSTPSKSGRIATR